MPPTPLVLAGGALGACLWCLPAGHLAHMGCSLASWLAQRCQPRKAWALLRPDCRSTSSCGC
eukprot:4271187-Prymnesium_polylepis.1